MRFRISAVLLAVALGGSYVWFRAAQARQGREAATAAAAGAAVTLPSTQPAITPSILMSGSKFAAVGYENPYPNGNAIGAGFKLNNDISAEFAVGSDICPGLPEPMPQTTNQTKPATAPSSRERSRQP
jgi:hypothetical protein